MDNQVKRVIIRNSFIRLIKNIKKKVEKKYSLITIYFFLIRTNFKKLINNVETKACQSNLEKIALSYNYTSHTKIFYSEIKQILRKRNNNPKHFKTKLKLLAYREIYLKKLKRRIFDNFKTYLKLKIVDQINYTKLLEIQTKYFSKLLLKQMKTVTRNSKSYLKNKIEILIKTCILDKLKSYSVREILRVEMERKTRRINFINKIKSFLTKIRNCEKKTSPERTKLIMKNKTFFYFKFQKQIKHRLNLARNKLKFFKLIKPKLFIRKIYKRIKNNKKINSTLSSLFVIINLNIKREFMNKFKLNNSNIQQKEKNYLATFIRKIFLQRALLHFNKKHKLKEKLIKFKTFYKNKIILKEKSILFSVLKLKRKYSYAILFYTAKSKKNIFNRMKENFYSMIEIKQKYIVSLLTFRKNYLKKLFIVLKINKLVRKEKKKLYGKIKEQREKVISSTLMQMLITNVSKEIIHKEEIMKNIFIKRSSRGIQTALKWFKKLRNRIRLKKQIQRGDWRNTTSICRASGIKSVYNNESLKMMNTLNVQQADNDNVIEEINLLISIKNKKRILPKKLEYV